jgi:hypothetical protein
MMQGLREAAQALCLAHEPDLFLDKLFSALCLLDKIFSVVRGQPRRQRLLQAPAQ